MPMVYSQNNMAGHEGTSAARSEDNSPIVRRATRNPVIKIADFVDRKLPGVTPNHLTFGGTVGNLAASVMAARAETPRQRKIATAVQILTGLTDGVDGTLARVKNANNPGSHDSKRGAIYDAVSDRAQELGQGLARAYAANKRGDKDGRRAALISTATNPIPSVMRALAEARGVKVPEAGKGIEGFIGTRFGRGGMAALGTLIPEANGYHVQAGLDLAVALANTNTATDRLSMAANGKIEERLIEDGPNKYKLNKDRPNRKDARRKLTAMLASTAITWVATGIAELTLKDPKNQSLKKDAEDKRAGLGKAAAIGALLTAGTAIYLRSKGEKQIEEPHEMAESENEVETHGQRYLDIISDFEKYSKEHDLQHLFVGGALADFEGLDTKPWFDHENRTVTLTDHPEASMIRSDGTVKDIDIIVMTRDTAAIKAAREYFKERAAEAKSQGLPYPQVSIEATYYPEGPKRKILRQFVSALEVDQENSMSYVLGKTSEEIITESMAPWTYILDDGTKITGRNPVAQAIAYSLRVPSGVKKKDKDVIVKEPEILIKDNPDKPGDIEILGAERKYNKTALVGRIAHQLIEEGKKRGIDYKEMFRPWINYTVRLHDRPDFMTFLKGLGTELYWDTIGTQVAHGAGLVGKLSSFNDKMAGQ